MQEYEDTLKDIENTIGIVPGFMKALPADVLVKEWPLFKKYELGESKIPAKYRELIGLAIASNIKCPYCQVFHTETAKMMGATDEEFAELAFLASFTSRWSAMIHAQNYDINKFVEELHQIGQHLQKMMEK
ncbi:MAG: carboxymuconolactone decarboxylase family protein [Planctomycetota bacterium]|jgi:AhpD family alkylhydroperoxidase